MTEEQWQAAWKLHKRIEDVAPEQLDDFLKASEADEEVRDAVRAMLTERAQQENPPQRSPGVLEWTGQKVGRYLMMQHLAEGGMGEVYLARDLELDRSVAVKILGVRVTGAGSLEEFSAEAKAASALNHPNIVTIYEVIHSNARLIIVMELIEGVALRQLCGSPVPVDRLVSIGEQISKALSAAHARGIVHCDIKPENLMIRPDGLVKVLDFGLARDLALSSSSSPASSGTLRYMSPEQTRGHAPSAASDIFSLGIVLYELSTGVHPFLEGSIFETINALNAKKPAVPSSFNAFLPPQLDDLILRMLAKEPDARPTAAEMRQVFESRFRDEVRETLVKKRVPGSATKRNLDWRIGAILLGVLGVAIIALLLWLPAKTRRAGTNESPLVQLDLELGDEVSDFAVSPDGGQIVLVKGNQLALRRLDQSEIRPLAATEGASYPFFSPDGKWVAFFADGKLRKIAVEGGAPVTLCDAQSGRGGSWGEDGLIVAALKSTGGLSIVSSSGGTPRPFTVLNAEAAGVTSHRWPQILPQGRGTLFTATIAGGAIGSLRVLSGGGGLMKTLVENSPYGRFLNGGYLVYYQAGKLFAARFDSERLQLSGPAIMLADHVAADTTRGAIFEVSISGTLLYRRGNEESGATLSWINAAGAIRRLAAKPQAYLTPRLSPDGKLLATAFPEGSEQNLWIYDMDRQASMRITFDNEPQLLPVWTPDGEFIVFRSGSSLAWVRADGNGAVERLTTGNLNPLPYSISRDGKWLFFSGDDGATGLDLYIVVIERTPGDLRLGQPRLLLRQAGGQYAPAISPDGHWVAYASDESGRAEIYVIPLSPAGTAGKGKWQVSNEGGVYPVWSRGGTQLFYRRGDRRLMEVTCTVKDGSFFPGKSALWTDRRLAVAAGFPSFDVAPDGTRVIGIFEPAGTATELVLRVLLNVDGELRRRSADATGR